MSSEKDYSVLPEVTIIQESAKIESEEHKPKKLRVCAYARVSTEKEEQEYSFENQRDYYMDYISKRSDWEFVGIYSDFGLSGKNKKRPQFIKMIDDCHAGKIDRIITKSISRFARNTIDCIQTVRDLREKGIGVYFEREGIDSLSPQSALVLSIMGAYIVPSTVTSIGNGAFAYCKRFKSIFIPKTVISIGKGAFDLDNSVQIMTDIENRPPKWDIDESQHKPIKWGCQEE